MRKYTERYKKDVQLSFLSQLRKRVEREVREEKRVGREREVQEEGSSKKELRSSSPKNPRKFRVFESLRFS